MKRISPVLYPELPRLAAFTLLLCVSGILSYPSTGYGQLGVDTLTLKAPIRHEYRADRTADETLQNRTQYQVAIRYSVGLSEAGDWGRLQLDGLAGTGSKYTSQWNTAYDALGDSRDPHPFYMRQIFLHWRLKEIRAEFGVIPPVKGTVSATSLDKDGWIRGGRFVTSIFSDGQLELVMGGLDRLTEPNAFQTWHSLNYFEVEWTQNWARTHRFELGLVRLKQQQYSRAEIRLRSAESAMGVFEVSGEALWNHTSETHAIDIGASAIWPWVTVSMEYAYVPEAFGILGLLSNDFLTNGHLLMGQLKGRLSSIKPLGWFLQQHVGESVMNTKIGVSLTHEFY